MPDFVNKATEIDLSTGNVVEREENPAHLELAAQAHRAGREQQRRQQELRTVILDKAAGDPAFAALVEMMGLADQETATGGGTKRADG